MRERYIPEEHPTDPIEASLLDDVDRLRGDHPSKSLEWAIFRILDARQMSDMRERGIMTGRLLKEFAKRERLSRERLVHDAATNPLRPEEVRRDRLLPGDDQNS